MKLNTLEKSEIDLLIGQMEGMSVKYAKSESGDCRYVAYFMGKFADRLEKLAYGYYDFETADEAGKEMKK